MTTDRAMTDAEWRETEAVDQARRELRERAARIAREVLANDGTWSDVVARLEAEL